MATFTESANYDSDCDLDIPQEFEGVDFGVKTKIEKAQIHSGYHRLNAGQCMDTCSAEIILDTQPIVPVMRLLWRSVRYQSTVTFVYSDGKENDEVEQKGAEAGCQEKAEVNGVMSQQSAQPTSAIIEIEELRADSGDAESTEQAVAKMNHLLKNQAISVAPKYQDVIRESMEFGINEIDSDEEESEEEDNECYQNIKKQVLKLLERKIDAKNYRKVYKECKSTSKQANKTWIIGSSYKPLKRVIREIKGQKK